MIMAGTRGLGFSRNTGRVAAYPFAVFVMAMSLTQTGETAWSACRSPWTRNCPSHRKRRTPEIQGTVCQAFELHSTHSQGKSSSQAGEHRVFGGRLEYGRLKWWAVLFAMLIVQAPAGDRRNWTAIRSWAADLPAVFQLEANPPS